MKPRVIIHLECDSVLREPKVVKALEELGIEITGTAYNPTCKVNVAGNKETEAPISLGEFQETVYRMLKGIRAESAMMLLRYLIEDIDSMKREIL